MTAIKAGFPQVGATEAPLIWIRRVLEALWLLTVVAVPLAFLGRDFGEWSSIIGSFELPKITLLRTLVALMAALWLIEWGLQGRFSLISFSLAWGKLVSPRAGFGIFVGWLNARPTRWVVLAVFLFVCSTLLSTFLSASFRVSVWGDVPGQDNYSAYTVVSYVVVFAVISTHLRNQAQLNRLLGAIVVMGVLVAGYGISQHYGQDLLNLMEPLTGTRATSTLGNAVFAGAVMLLTIPISLALAAATLKGPFVSMRFSPKLVLWSLVLTVQFLGLVFTFSRGAWLGTAVALAVLLVLASLFIGWRTLARITMVLGMAAIATWVIVLSVPEHAPVQAAEARSGAPVTATQLTQRVTSIGSSIAGGGLSGRIGIWEHSWQLMTQHPWVGFESLSLSPIRPIIGYGPDLFRTAYVLVSPPGAQFKIPEENDHAHNFFIHQGVELGFVGLLSALGIFGAIFLVGMKQLFRQRGGYSQLQSLILVALLATIAGRFLEQNVGVARVSDITVFWVLLAAFVSLPRIAWASEAVDEPASRRQPAPASGRSQSSRISRPQTYHWQALGRLVLAAGLIAAIIVLTWTKTVNYYRAGIIVDRSAQQYREGLLLDSLASLDEAIGLAPDVSSYYQRRAEVFFAIRRDPQTSLATVCGEDTGRSSLAICMAREAYSTNFVWNEQRPHQYRSRLALGDSALYLGRLEGNPSLMDEGIRLYREALEMVPNSWLLLHHLARVYIENGQPEQAIPLLEKSLTFTGWEDWSKPEAWLLKGLAYWTLREFDKSLEALNRNIETVKSYEAYFARGSIYSEAGQFSKAIEDLDEAVRINPEYALAFYARGTTYDNLGRSRRAIQDFDRALYLNPELAFVYNGRGLTYAKLGELDQALADFTRAIQLDSELAAAYNNRGMVRRDLGKLELAIEDLDTAIRLDSDFMMAFYNRALAYTLLNMDEYAQLDAQRAVNLGFDIFALRRAIGKLQENR